MAHIFEAAPLYISKFYSGLITRRSALTTPIRIMGRRIIELFDALWNGSVNMELGPLAKLQRRPGFLTFNSNTLLGIPQNYYSFKNATTRTIYPIVDTTTNVYYVTSGSATPTSLVNKGGSAAQTTFKGVGSLLYMGNDVFSKKWDGGVQQGVTNWGITQYSTTSSSSAYCGTAADAGAVGGFPASAWTNITNMQGSPDAAYATDTPGGNNYSNYANCTNYGFTIPAANAIQGITVTVTYHVSAAATFPTLFAALLVNGVIAGSYRLGYLTSTSDTTVVLGGSSDPWGVSGLSPAVVNSANFGVQITVRNAANAVTSSIDSIQITVANSGAPNVTFTGTGLTAQVGFAYVICWGNSVTGHVGSPSVVSNIVKPANQNMSVPVVASTDAQVNQIRVFRTTDGGPLNQFFELPNSPFANISTSITDSATDGSLSLVQAPQPLVNNPPPTGLTNMEWYAGRLWGSVGNLLYFSTGPDTTLGNPQECWAPGYVFVLPTAIVKLVAIPSGMLVWTLDAVHIVQGTSTPSFTVNYFLQDIGARTYNAIDTDGSMIYAFTSDRHLLTINAGGTGEPGYNVGDILDTLDPTLVYLSCHRSGSLDQKLFISDGSTNLYSYDLSFQAWNPKAVPTGGLNAIGSIEITPGVYKFLLGATIAGQVVLQRDLATFQDNGTSYTCTGVLGSFQLADPGMLAALEAIAIEYANVGSDPTVGILAGEISGTFTTVTNPVNEPPEFAVPNQSFNAKRWNIRQAAIDQNMRHFQLSISFPAENFKNEVFGIGMWGPLATSNVQPTKMPQIQGR